MSQHEPGGIGEVAAYRAHGPAVTPILGPAFFLVKDLPQVVFDALTRGLVELGAQLGELSLEVPAIFAPHPGSHVMLLSQQIPRLD